MGTGYAKYKEIQNLSWDYMDKIPIQYVFNYDVNSFNEMIDDNIKLTQENEPKCESKLSKFLQEYDLVQRRERPSEVVFQRESKSCYSPNSLTPRPKITKQQRSISLNSLLQESSEISEPKIEVTTDYDKETIQV